MLVDIFIINLLCVYVWLVYEHMHVWHSGQKGMLGVLLCHSMRHAFQAVSLTEPRTRLAAWKPQWSSGFCLSYDWGWRYTRCQLFLWLLGLWPEVLMLAQKTLYSPPYAVQLRCVQPFYCCSVDAACFFHCKGGSVTRTRQGLQQLTLTP